MTGVTAMELAAIVAIVTTEVPVVPEKNRGERMSKLHNVASRKHKKNRPGPHTTAEETKATAEQKALQKVKATAVQKAATEAELREQALQAIAQLYGVRDEKLAAVLVGQAALIRTAWSFGVGGAADTAMTLLLEMEPKTVNETLLAVQMIGVHNAALASLQRAALSDGSREGGDHHMVRAIRLLRLFNEQSEAFQKLKGKAGQQKVTVEHVHVHQGGQAIVGAVTAPGRTEGEAKQEGENDENRTNSTGKAARLVEKRKSARRLLPGGSLRS